jgi:hypothetical protein
LFPAFELSWGQWKLAFGTGPASYPRLRSMSARNTQALVQEIAKAKKRFFWGFGSATAFVIFRELRRRGQWVPPGWPRLAAAAYAATMLFAASVVLAGSVVCLQLVFGGST